MIDALRSQAHASTSYKGRQVEIDVRRDAPHTGSHIIVVVHGSDASQQERRVVEYVTDDVQLDDAIGAGVAFAQALVDGRGH